MVHIKKLENLKVSSGTLTPVFSSTVKEYTLNLGSNWEQVNDVKFIPTSIDVGMQITINGETVENKEKSPLVHITNLGNVVTIRVSDGNERNMV